MAREPWSGRRLTATERYFYWGGFLAGLGLGTFVGYSFHSDGIINVKTGLVFLPCFFVALILSPLIVRRGQRAESESA
jgi:hypothetical protein